MIYKVWDEIENESPVKHIAEVNSKNAENAAEQAAILLGLNHVYAIFSVHDGSMIHRIGVEK